MAECLLALLDGRADDAAGDDDGHDNEETAVAMADLREEQRISHDARRFMGAELVAESLIYLRLGVRKLGAGGAPPTRRPRRG